MPDRYIFRVGKNPKKIPYVKADNYNQAATITARYLYGKCTSAVRVWGMNDFSGYFQAFTVNSTTRERTLLGEPFHLQMLTAVTFKIPIKDEYKLWNGLQYIRNRNLH